MDRKVKYFQVSKWHQAEKSSREKARIKRDLYGRIRQELKDRGFLILGEEWHAYFDMPHLADAYRVFAHAIYLGKRKVRDRKHALLRQRLIEANIRGSDKVVIEKAI